MNQLLNIDGRHIAAALCGAESTIEAIGKLDPSVLRLVGTEHFKMLSESADIARSILTRHWLAVNALANRLLEVSWMTSTELKLFLKEHGVRKVGRL